ncbi:MAG: AraC family transcriptional regulator [Lachnospiraceae bacterium]|nr:AraC family transcriptional regulator [Lachnospiraceae bacterium]
MTHNFYGFINYDAISPLPMVLYDMGVELRQDENYYYDNSNRTNYDGYIIQYTLSGYGVYESEGSLYNLEKNKGFITCVPNNSKYYLPNQKDSSWEYIYVHFSGSVAGQFYDEIKRVSGNTFTLPFDNPAIQLLINEYELLEHGKQYRRFESGAFIYNFLTTLLREISAPGLSDSQITDAVNHINTNYNTDISLAELSKNLGITAPQLSRLFHKEIGINPIEYLTNVRLEHSMQLLTMTNLGINEIASLCGFANGNYFTKVFKRKLGFTPSQYRMNH